LKYDDQGNLEWTKRYDFASLRDGAVGLELSANYQDVIITGASASTATNWDFVTIKYDASNGNALNTVRQPTGANGYDQPVSICKDDNGNIYVTGAALTGNGVGNDMQTIKIDSTFAIEWVRQYDGHGYDDAGKDVKVDANGDIYVVGYSQKADLGYDFMTIK
jgi:hypothetical protein